MILNSLNALGAVVSTLPDPGLGLNKDMFLIFLIGFKTIFIIVAKCKLQIAASFSEFHTCESILALCIHNTGCSAGTDKKYEHIAQVRKAS